MKKKVLVGIFCLVTVLVMISSNAYAAQSTNKAWSKETLQIRYDGYIKFVPSFKIPSNPGYSLVIGKHVKRAYVNFTRDRQSVTTNGGRLYTSTASSKTSSITYSAHAKAWDSLNPWAPVTKFKYGWIYF